MVNRKFWAGTFTLTGTVIGAGILGLPYVFAKSGFLIGLMWLVILLGVMMFTKLCLGEVCLRTRKRHQLPGYAERYLGKWGKRLMFFALMFGIYSALLAYLIGEGESLSQLFTGSLNYSIYFAIGFWIIMTLLLSKGIKELKRIETYGVIVIILLVIGIGVYFLPSISLDNLKPVSFSNMFLPFGIVLFSLLGFTSIPEVRVEMDKQEKKIKKAIMLGSLIPALLYILFCLVFVGVLGSGVPQVATLSLGRVVTILGIFTMLTSYFVLSFSLKDSFTYDLNVRHMYSGFFVSVLPLVLYLLVYFFKLAGFVTILGLAGVIGGGLTGILSLLMLKKAKKKGDRKPEYEIPLNWFVILLLVCIFVFGVVSVLVL